MDERTNQVSAAADSDEYDENTEQLRADIEDTRADMSQTLNEIQERLSPENLMDQAKEAVREATIGKVERAMGQVGETLSAVTQPAREVAGRAGNAIKEVGTTVGDQIWKNPIPVALIGLGVGMLVVRNFSTGGTRSTGRTLPNRRSNYALGDVKETATDLASRAKDSASAVGSRFGEVLRENPLAVSAVAVAAGTAVGLILPSTQFESEYIGETGEKLVESVEDVARDALGKVQDAAKQMQQQQPRA